MVVVSENPVSERQRQLVALTVDQILLRVETAVHQPTILDFRISSTQLKLARIASTVYLRRIHNYGPELLADASNGHK